MIRRSLYALGALYAAFVLASTVWATLTDERLVRVCARGLLGVVHVMSARETWAVLWLCDVRERLGLPGPPPLRWVSE